MLFLDFVWFHFVIVWLLIVRVQVSFSFSIALFRFGGLASWLAAVFM